MKVMTLANVAQDALSRVYGENRFSTACRRMANKSFDYAIEHKRRALNLQLKLCEAAGLDGYAINTQNEIQLLERELKKKAENEASQPPSDVYSTRNQTLLLKQGSSYLNIVGAVEDIDMKIGVLTIGTEQEVSVMFPRECKCGREECQVQQLRRVISGYSESKSLVFWNLRVIDGKNYVIQSGEVELVT